MNLHNDCRFKHYLPATGKDVTDLKISVYYSKGGLNFYNGKNEPSAIWAGLTPLKRDTSNGFRTEQFIMGRGLKINLEPAERLNRKRVEAAFQRVLADVTMKTGRVWDAIQQVCITEGVTLVENVRLPVAPTA